MNNREPVFGNEPVLSYYPLIKNNNVNLLRINLLKTIKAHTKCVNTMKFLADGRLASCSNDETIKIYDIKNDYKVDITIPTEQTGGVTSFCQLDNGKIVSCSKDKSLKIWSITDKSYKCELTIPNAQDEEIVFVTGFPKDRMASCSEKKLVIRYSYSPCETIMTLTDFEYDLNNIFVIKGKDLFVTWCNKIKIWNLNTYTLEGEIKDVYDSHQNGIIQLDDHRLLLGGGKRMYVVDFIKCEILQEAQIENYNVIIVPMLTRDGNMLGMGNHGIFWLYDIKGNVYEAMENEKYYDINSLCMLTIDDRKFITCDKEDSISECEH